MSENPQIPEFRRNLSLAACQPCRKAKIGCDHAQPCNRCVRRGLQHLCVYRTVEEPSIVPASALGAGETPAPALKHRLIQIERSLQNLQRQLQPDASSPQSRKRRREDEEAALATQFRQDSSIGPASRLTTQTNEPIVPSVEISPDECSSHTSDIPEEPVVGPNTDNDVLREFISTREHFKGLFDALPAQRPVGSALPLWASPSEEWTLQQHRQDLGESIIGNLPSKAICEDLLRVYYGVFNHIRPCVPQQWADRALQEIFDLDNRMEVVGNVSSKVGIIEAYISEGSSLCADLPSLVNWNTIGTLAALFAIAAATAPQLLNAEALSSCTRVQNVHEFALRMRKVVGMCWELQKPTEYADESTILLLYNYTFMLIVLGEYIPFMEHLFGCLVHATVVNQLHREPSKIEQDVDYLERRRTEYAAIYHLDKMRATYRGRAPSMFHRFSNMQLPSTKTQEDRHLRGQLLLSQAREEVLELILTSTRSSSTEQLRSLQKTVLDRYNLITPELKYNHTMPLSTSRASLNAQRMVLYLFSLENSFILQSVARKRLKASPESDLLKVSVSMFSAVVRIWEEREKFENFTFLLSWFLMSYAMASAGVIFSAILQQRTDAKLSSDVPSLPPPFDSRPFWMHQLQQFLAALRSIISNDPHFERCQKALRIFTRVHEVLVGEGTSTTEKYCQIQPRPSGIPFTGSQTVVDVGPATVSDSASTDYYTESGLNQNLGWFGALPWLEGVWMDFGGDDSVGMMGDGMDMGIFNGDATGMEGWRGW